MRADMLSDEMLDRLLRTSNLAEASNVLQELKRGVTSPAGTEQASVERLLLEDMLASVGKIASYCPSECAKLLAQFAKAHELQCVKTLVRATSDGLDPEQALRSIVPAGSYSLEACRNLLEARNLARVAESIPFDSLRRSVSAAVASNDSLNQIEATIDSFWYAQTWALTKFSVIEDMNLTRSLIGEDADIHNLLQIARAQAMGLPASNTKKLLLPIQFRLGSSVIDAVDAGSALNALRSFAKGRFALVIAGFANSYKEGDSLFPLEILLKRYHATRCNAAFQGFPFVPALPVAFAYLKNYELADLTTILNGKRDGLPETTIRRSLVLTHSEAE